MKICNSLLIFAQNLDCGYTLDSTKYVLEQKLEKNVYPCKPSFTI